MIIYLGLGSNLGNRLRNLQAAAAALQDCGRVMAAGSLYESAAMGQSGQQPYWNTALQVETVLQPSELLAAVKRIEHAMGRRPGRRWDSRPLDIDLLLADVEVHKPDLVVPHPLLAERNFVLWPLADIADGVRHPGLGATIGDLRDALPDDGLRRIAGARWLNLRSLHPRRLDAELPGLAQLPAHDGG